MTRARPQRSWALQLPDGGTIAIERDTIIGRAPTDAAHPGAALVRIDGYEKSVSKSHLLLLLAPDGLSVRDLGSVNGVFLVRSNGAEVEVSANSPVRLEVGDQLDLGALVLEVTRS